MAHSSLVSDPGLQAGGVETVHEPPRRVMVVDDEIAVATLIEKSLLGQGYEVVAFQDPEEALTAFRSEPGALDALVTDQRMPGLTGLELAHSMHELSPDLPVLIVTGYSDAGDFAEVDVRAVLGKPFTQQELIQAVAALFQEV